MEQATQFDDRLDLEARLRFETLLADVSAQLVNLPVDQVDAAIERMQQQVCECLQLDLAALWQWEADTPDVFILTHYYRPLGGPPVPERMEATTYFPWTLAQLRAGRTIIMSSTEETPPEAACDLASWRHYQIKSNLAFPLAAGGGEPFGVLSFNDMRAERAWSDDLVRRLKLVAQVFANAIARKRADQALRLSEARLSLAADSAGAGLWSLNLASNSFWLTAKARELFGFGADEHVTFDRLLQVVHAEDRGRVQEALQRVRDSGREGDVEYRVVLGGERVRWFASRGRLRTKLPGETSDVVMGVTVDVTERKQTEASLQQALGEVQRLRDHLQQENVYLREQIRSETGHGAIVGESQPILSMLAQARKVASTGAAVLITGETGTGKELLAQAIHDLSPRQRKTMVKVNCAALPAPLIESELFGREKGAYTGALTQQVGRFEIANGSTIFLDEIGDLPLELQAKLLRVLQDGRYERLGSHRTIEVDVRVIAATNHNLAAMVRRGAFREDLFHRLNVFPLEVPPLRERVADIPLLVWTFVREFNTKIGRSIDSIPKATMERIKQYAWPGNVRELRNVIERAMIVSERRSLSIELPEVHASVDDAFVTLEAVERRHILDVLGRKHWRISGKGGAAEVLGLVPTTLHSRMKRLGIKRP